MTRTTRARVGARAGCAWDARVRARASVSRARARWTSRRGVDTRDALTRGTKYLGEIIGRGLVGRRAGVARASVGSSAIVNADVAASRVARELASDGMELWGTSDASDALWWLASHPAFGAAAVLGVVWLVPRAVDAAWKYVVLPGVILLLVVVVVTTPAEALGFFGAAAREVAGHPEEILAVTVVFAVIALGPYLVGGAIVALLISGATILPGVFKPLLPPEVVRATEQVDSIASRVREERSFFDSFAKEVNDKRTSLKMQRSNGNATVSAPTLVENRTKPMKKTSATRAREDAIRVRERREQKRELEKRKQQYLADKTTAT